MRTATAAEILAAASAVSKRKEAGKLATITARKARSCPYCQQRSEDGLLCHRCSGHTKRALSDLIEWWPDLWQTITRQDKLSKPGEGHGINASRPLAYHYDAAELANEIRASLVGWVRVTVEDLGAPYPHDSISAMSDHLTRWLPQIRKHEAACELVEEVTGWPAKIKRVVDYADERATIPVGPCPEQVEDVPCRGQVRAVLFEDEHTSPVMRCGKCKHEWPSWEWRRAAKRISENA